jgi:transposase InsO family protein
MYFLIFIDNFSRKVWVYFMRHKSKTFVKFKLWKAGLEKQIGSKVKCLRTYNNIEYTNAKFRNFYK